MRCASKHECCFERESCATAEGFSQSQEQTTFDSADKESCDFSVRAEEEQPQETLQKRGKMTQTTIPVSPNGMTTTDMNKEIQSFCDKAKEEYIQSRKKLLWYVLLKRLLAEDYRLNVPQ